MAISLDSIKKNVSKPPIITIFGPPGIGKSSFAANSENPVFILTEDGLGILDAASFPLAKTFDEIVHSLNVLTTDEHDYKTLVLDSLDHMEPLIWEQVCLDNNVKTIEKLSYGKGYVEAQNYWRMFFEGVRYLRDNKNMTIIMTAHSQIIRIEDPMHPSYDTHSLKLHKRASALAEEVSDIILFADMKTFITTEESGFNQKRTRAISSGNRVIYTQMTSSFTAKNRYNLPPELPLDWLAFQEAMNKNRTENKPSNQQTTQPTQQKEK